MRSGLCYLGDLDVSKTWRDRVLTKSKSPWVDSKEEIPEEIVLQDLLGFISESESISILGVSNVGWHKEKLPCGARYTTLLVLESAHTLVVKDRRGFMKVEPLHPGNIFRFNPNLEHRLDRKEGSTANFYALAYDGRCLSYAQVIKHFNWLNS